MHQAGRARNVRETLRRTARVRLGISRPSRIPPGLRLAKPELSTAETGAIGASR
jgi:hypothetical protein